MTYKFLKISSGKDLPPKRFEITEVEANIFMLKTKESKTELVETLDKWLQSNYSLRESGYGEMLYERSSSMRQVLSEDVSPNFLEEMIEEADQADNLFIGGENNLWQWSVSQKKVTKDYGEIMRGRILSMVQTSDKKYLFVSDPFGCQKQIDVKKQEVMRDFGRIHDGILSIAITNNNKYLFTSDFENNGYVRQFSVRNGQMIKDQGVIFENDGIHSITTTPNNKWIFAASNGGRLKQISLESQQVVHDYRNIHDESITCLETTRDSNWLITGSWDGHVKRISVENREVDRDLGMISQDWVTRIKIMANGEKLLVGDQVGRLKLISSEDGKVIKDFGQIHDDYISGIMIAVDQKFFFTSSLYGELKQWTYGDNTLVREHEEIADDIRSLCL